VALRRRRGRPTGPHRREARPPAGVGLAGLSVGRGPPARRRDPRHASPAWPDWYA